MAYNLKYFTEAKDPRGDFARIEIYTEQEVPHAPNDIWGLTGLELHVQGGQDQITCPIIKTSLTFTLIEPPTPGYFEEEGVTHKKGDWREFFTPDSDLYKVVLKTRETSEGSWMTRWSGYITPDSWQESLDSYDGVTITARDNIGHLQDFDFDAEGTNRLISIKEIFEGAMAKINAPMPYIIRNESYLDVKQLYFDDEAGNSYELTQAKVNVSLFEGKTWYDALEQTLEAIGWTLRWCDFNRFIFCSLRNLPLLSSVEKGDVPVQEIEFYSGGTRTLDPAYKEIREEVTYGYDDTIEQIADTNLRRWSISRELYTFRVDSLNIYGNSTWVQMQAYCRARYCSGLYGGFTNISASLRASDYELYDFTYESEGDAARDYLFVPANLKSNYDSAGSDTFRWQHFLQSTACKITFEFTEHPMCATPQTEEKLGTFHWYNLKHIKYSVEYSDGNSLYAWDGHTWVSVALGDAPILTETYDPESEAASELTIELTECQEIGPNAVLSVVFCDIRYVNVILYAYGYGCWARVKRITLQNAQGTMLRKNSVTTINNPAYNVKSERKPAFSPMLKTVGFTTPENYKSGMFRSPGLSVFCWPYACRWSGEAPEAALPFPAQIHMQLLQYHHTTFEILEGEVGVVESATGGELDRPPIYFDTIFLYKGKKHLLLSGNLDLLTGRLNGAIFREYLDWDELWDE